MLLHWLERPGPKVMRPTRRNWVMFGKTLANADRTFSMRRTIFALAYLPDMEPDASNAIMASSLHVLVLRFLRTRRNFVSHKSSQGDSGEPNVEKAWQDHGVRSAKFCCVNRAINEAPSATPGPLGRWLLQNYPRTVRPPLQKSDRPSPLLTVVWAKAVRWKLRA